MSRNYTVLLTVLLGIFMLSGVCSAQLPDPNALFSGEPEEPKPVVLDSTTAEILASETLTAYELAKLEVPEYPWEIAVQLKINSSQSSYSNNWDGSEKGSYVWNADFSGTFQKQLNHYSNSRTTYRLAYGQTHTQDNTTRYWKIPTPSTDRIDIESLMLFTLGAIVDPFAAGRVESSFLDARDSDKDFYNNPVKFTESIGMARAFLKEDKKELLVRAGFALKHSWDRNALLDEEKDLRGKRWTDDGGLDMVTDFKYPLLNNKINFKARLSIYQAFFYSEADKEKNEAYSDYWKMVDLDLESSFSASITDHLNVSLDIWWRYDKEIDKQGRLKQAISLGINF